MSKQTFTQHLYWDELRNEFELWASANMSSNYSVYIAPVEVEAEVPDNFDVRAAKLAHIKGQEKKLRAEFQARLTELQRQAQELMAIEMTVEAE